MAFKKGQSGNPSGKRKAPAKPEVREDGFANLVTGLGIVGKDKRVSTAFLAQVVDPYTARDLWRGNDIAARVVETVPTEMFRRGFEVCLDDKEQSEAANAALEELGATEALTRATEFERAYGGGAIWPVINDRAGDLAMPLNEEAITEITHLQVFEARELQPITYYSDPLDPKYGEPEIFSVTPLGQAAGTGFNIHETRLIRFVGIRTGREHPEGAPVGWGDNVFTRMYSVLRDFESAWGSAGVLVQDFAQAVWKMKDLAEVVVFDKGRKLKNRLEAMELGRSTLNATVIDSEEDFARQQTPVTGLPDLLDRFATRLASACSMPLTMLMGQSPGGLNATGESDRIFFYDSVAGEQAKHTPHVERLIYLLLRSKTGPTRGKEPEQWSCKWYPLLQPDEGEQAAARKAQAETDAIYITNGVVSPEEVALARFGGDTYSFDTKIDFEARARLEPAVASVPTPEAENAEESGNYNDPDIEETPEEELEPEDEDAGA